MPIDYLQDDARRRVRLEARGPISLEETLAVAERQAAGGAWDYAVLYDARGREGPTLTPGDLRVIVERVQLLSATHGALGPMAVIAKDITGFGIARMYALLGESLQRTIAVFTDLPAAEAWLADMGGAPRAKARPPGKRPPAAAHPRPRQRR